MNWRRVNAILLKQRFNFKRDIFRIFDIFWWPVFELFIWGLFSTYLEKSSANNLNLVNIILGAVILWTFFERASKDISIVFIDELWDKNFINLFSTPLSLTEYLVGIIIVAIAKLITSAVFMLILVDIFYSFQIVNFGWFFVPAAIGITIMGWSMSLVVQSAIMRWGHTVEVFIWAVATIVQPFSCVFYPLSALPGWMQNIAVLLPTTYIFENMRSNMSGRGVNTNQLIIAFGLNIIYLVITLWIFYKSYAHAKEQGLLIKNY